MPNLNTGPAYTFGAELRRLRTHAGLTLRSLTQRAGFDYSYLAQVERGDRFGSAKLAGQCDEALKAHGSLVRLFAVQKAQQLMSAGTSALVPAPAVVLSFICGGTRLRVRPSHRLNGGLTPADVPRNSSRPNR